MRGRGRSPGHFTLVAGPEAENGPRQVRYRYRLQSAATVLVQRAGGQAPKHRREQWAPHPIFFPFLPKEGGHQELTQASPLHNSPSVVVGQVAFPPHAQSLPHSKKAALALPIHSLSLSFLPYNSPTQNRLCTQYASVRLRGEYCPILSYHSPQHRHKIIFYVFHFLALRLPCGKVLIRLRYRFLSKRCSRLGCIASIPAHHLHLETLSRDSFTR